MCDVYYISNTYNMGEQSCRLLLDKELEKRQERMHLAKAREIHLCVTTFLQLSGNCRLFSPKKLKQELFINV